MSDCISHDFCINKAIYNAEEIFTRRKIPFTPLRKQVLKAIWQSHLPLRVSEIISKLKDDGFNIKPITLYRILDLLLENRIIHKISSQNSFIGCSHPKDNHACYFHICKKCFSVEENCSSKFIDQIASEAKNHNFKIENFILEIEGICRNCQN